MYLYGASGHAKVIIDILRANGIKVDALIDDDVTIDELMSIPVLHRWEGQSPLVVSVGNNISRKQIVERLGSECEYITAVHPSAIISSYARIGAGTVVMQGSTIQSSAQIGRHCIINTNSSIDHECIIDDYVHISPQATLCGNVHVGKGAWIGASTVIIPGVKVGQWSVVGAGSVVVNDIPDGVVAYGNPCQVKSHRIDIAGSSYCPSAVVSKRIAIYGAGGLGREVAGGINRINKACKEHWNLVGFYDDSIPVGSSVSHYGQVIGNMDDLNAVDTPLALAIAVGTPTSRKLIHERILNPNIYFPNLIAPSFKVLDPETFKIGQGNIIQNSCSVTCDVTIGDFNVFNGFNVMGHDDVIGNFNVLMPNVHLSGAVKLGDCNLLGVGSIVLQQISIGDHVTLGAGSVLMTKPKDGCTYIGVPAKKFDFK